MADYVQKLRDDLVEQFKGKPVIDALMEAVGDELNEVRQFYEDLCDKRNIQTAIGKQLDGIGGNAVLTRLEAGALACTRESVYVLNDDDYRRNGRRCADAGHSGARLYDHDPAGDSSWRGLYRHRAAGPRSTEHHADETARNRGG